MLSLDTVYLHYLKNGLCFYVYPIKSLIFFDCFVNLIRTDLAKLSSNELYLLIKKSFNTEKLIVSPQSSNISSFLLKWIIEFIKFDNNRRFFKKLSVGMPDALVPVKDTMELIKNIILGRNSWSVFKETGKSRGEWKLVKNFLEELDVDSICAEIVDKLNCSQIEAKKQLDEFVSVAAQYIDGNSIEDSIIEAIIVTDERLMTKCKKILKNDWEEENKKEIAQKQNGFEGR